ncbi:MAG TPA: AAA family ATPase [Candidatus Hydrogenedentes bacterium]|nr:AAA family ATPase [Candidatus Hydrogenedentota bacterium]
MTQQTASTSPAAPLSPFQEKLRTYIRAGYPILYLVTAEEDRAIKLIAGILKEGEAPRRKPYVWSVSRGLCTVDLRPVAAAAPKNPELILPFLLEREDPGIFILEDFHFFLDERAPTSPLIIRQLRDVIGPFKGSYKTIVILSSVLKIPPELEKDVTVIDLELPDEAELLAILEDNIEQFRDDPKVETNLGEGDRERIVKALNGLTLMEAENALAKVIVTNRRIDARDVDLLLAEKEQIIRKSAMLEFYSTPERFGTVGGLDLLKAWLQQRGKAFSDAARAFGLPSPKGLLLVGVPGCGKSLTAKAVAAEWQMPLLKFDLGKVFAPLVGQAEDNMRRAIKMAEAVAPCVLWIDEIEKGLAGTRGPQGDSGVTARVFGTLLTWMEEKTKAVFTIATANDIEGLPPELLRKGRFDDVFFIDLPTPQERANVLAIHLAKHHRDYNDFALERHVAACDGFSGAEIEQAVISSLYLAFAEGEKAKLEDRHLEQAITTTVPLSRSVDPKVRVLWDEARRKWRRASSEGVAGAAAGADAVSEPPPAPKQPKRVFEF